MAMRQRAGLGLAMEPGGGLDTDPRGDGGSVLLGWCGMGSCSGMGTVTIMMCSQLPDPWKLIGQCCLLGSAICVEHRTCCVLLCSVRCLIGNQRRLFPPLVSLSSLACSSTIFLFCFCRYPDTISRTCIHDIHMHRHRAAPHATKLLGSGLMGTCIHGGGYGAWY